MPLVLSIFPGIDLLGRAFEEEDYCIVRGPDPLWGGDIRSFHPPAGVFDGIIGGPPCQHWTRLMFLNPKAGDGKDWVVNEYARVVEEAQPSWFLMEEVVYAPLPLVPGYHDYDVVLRDNEVGGVQPRVRRFTFGTRDYRMLNVVGWERVNESVRFTVLSDGRPSPGTRDERRVGALAHGRKQSVLGNGHDPAALLISGQEAKRRKQSVLADGRTVPVRIGGNGKEKRTVTTSGRNGTGDIRARHLEKRNGGTLPHEGQSIGLADMCEAQGLPRDFTDGMPFTKHGKQLLIGNGVPQAMGKAVARAVREATK